MNINVRLSRGGFWEVRVVGIDEFDGETCIAYDVDRDRAIDQGLTRLQQTIDDLREVRERHHE